MSSGVKISDLTAASTFTGSEAFPVVQSSATLKGTADQMTAYVAAATATLTNKIISGAANTITNVSLTTGVTGTLPVANGGTGVATYAAGDLLYATATTTLAKLAATATTFVLLSGTAPSWGKVNVASAVTGTMAILNGGTGATTANDAITNLFGGYTGTGNAVRKTSPTLDGTITFGGHVVANGTTLSSDLGPSGAALTPFGQTYGYNYASGGGSTHNAQIHFTLGAVANVAGSGTFGPASMDAATFSSIQKSSYLSSTVEGEVNAYVAVAYQGRKGDVSAFLGEARKVKGTVDDNGSVLGMETGFIWMDSAGTVTQNAHSIIAFGESTGGVSGGQGYGFYSESWGNPGGTSAGQLFAAYYVSTYDGYSIGSGNSFGTKHVLYATTQRSAANRYFDILGDVVTGSQRPGDIIQGVSGNSKILRTTSGGIFQVRNDADTATLFSLTDAGAAGLGVGSGSAGLTIDGGASGAADGAFIRFSNAGVGKAILGNASTITGAGYTTDFALYLVSGGFDLYTAGAKNLTVSTTGALGVVGASTILNATAIPAGGTAGSGYKFSSTANFGVFFGSGAPSLSAAKGSLYLRSDGSGTTDRAYINTDGSTTWTALTTVA